jgi:HAMP domain-containing protein
MAAIRRKALATSTVLAESKAIATPQTPQETTMTTQRHFTSAPQHAAAAGLALVVTVSVLSALLGLADAYRSDAAQTLAASTPAAQQVVVVGASAPKV